ncbi:hypothetical protein CPT_Moogle102 [Citrobacter phage Moogle]|uniref:Uncharacterized protein n=2 Tax=Mooglevirus moogle TaxID=1985304 RepID=A0A0A0RQB1_9CAUD|nr:hypothetical protein CPT_Moogle102 [Citrobacter phage Moogle]AIW03839.1 hypothetical protein CPT_Moogle102 [Citrobacter phage Moogle]ARB06599.1 hypothetical protein CPT_Mijalis104 [Citrobacter phage Mijalis]
MGHRLKKSWKNLTDMVPLLKRKKKCSEEWEAVTKKCFKDLIEMKKFELDRKYLVLSINDINTYLSEGEQAYLNNIVEILYNARIEDCKDQLEGIFIKKSYPFYEDTLKKLEMYVKQQNRKEVSMISLGGHIMRVLEDINPSRVNKGVCIKVTEKEEFIDIGHLRNVVEGGSISLNGNHYYIQTYPIKDSQIMLQIMECNSGFTHFFQTTKQAIQAIIEELC